MSFICKKQYYLFAFIIFTIVLFVNISCVDPEEESKVNMEKLNSAFRNAGSLSGLKNILVSYKGEIIKEEYFNGSNSSEESDVRSVTKSITSLLIGIAINKGLINSIENNIKDYLITAAPSFPADKESVKIKHLITMSGGFRGNELLETGLYSQWAVSDNRINYILSTPLDYAPGEHFSYDSRPYNLLSVILTLSSGITAKEFAAQYLLTPLGLTSRNWLADNLGYNNGSAGIYLTGRDMIKIGELVLNKGFYQGNSIIPESWVNELERPKIFANGNMQFATDYSYGWWVGNRNGVDYFFATGWGGQFIVIVPKYNLVVSAANEWRGVPDNSANQRWMNTMNLIINEILTAFK